jgi:aminomethyltransferase
MTDPLKRTPLHAFHVDHGARMVPFAGWEMPVQYTSILEEHRAVREAAGLFDVSHMGEARVHGPEAILFLNHLVTNDISRLETGKALYTVMCYEDGGVVDDLIIYQVGDEEYFLCLNAANVEKDIEWMAGQAVGFDCLLDDVSGNFGQLALQGPNALEVFRAASGADLSGLRRFQFVQGAFMETHALVSRTGYTGEDGLELYLPAGETARVANRLLETGKAHGLCLAGLGARDSLRLEAGYPLYGHEISSAIDPLTGGLGWVVKFDKAAAFVGKEALSRIREQGSGQKVVFFRLDDRRIAREGATVVDSQGQPCGKVLSGTQSPMLGQPIGSAIIQLKALNGKEPVYVEIRRNRIMLEITRPPLHRQP